MCLKLKVVKLAYKLSPCVPRSIGNAALPYTEYRLRMLKFEIRSEINECDANGRGGACTKRCLCESVKNACGSLQMS